MQERRVHRSAEPRKALALFLQSSKGRMGAHALAVSTSNGWLVAGAGDGAILVAALAAREAAPAANVSIENRGAQRSDSRRSLSGAWGAEPPISIEKLAVADQEYVVSAFGAAVLPEVGDAVRRILS